MGKSPRTRMREYRLRVKQDKDKHQASLEKDKYRKQATRSNEQQSGIKSEVKTHRDKLNKERVSNFRAKKKINFEEKQSSVYASQRSLGKAVSRASRSLPMSPRKKSVVVSKLAERVGLIKSTIKSKHVISNEVRAKVEAFYSCDDISRQAPGKKDYITIWKETGKIKLQKRHLYNTIKETYSLFMVDYPDAKIGKSKFAELKPANVLHRSQTPKDACLCMYHENIILLCDALHKVIPSFPVYSSSFVDKMVCSSHSKKCMMGNCDKCSNKAESWIHSFVEPDVNSKEICWCEWAREEEIGMAHSRRNANKVADDGKISSSKKMMKKSCRAGSVAEAIESLILKMPKFLSHVFIKREQSDFFHDRCQKLVSPTATLPISAEDFVLCRYEEELFPGQVTFVHPGGKGARIKVFEKCAGGWRWPKQADEIDYIQEDIVEKIKFPQPINNRGTYRIVELEQRWGIN